MRGLKLLSEFSNRNYHRVDRVLGFLQSSEFRPPTTPHPQASVSPPLVPGGTNSLGGRGEGVGGPKSDEGTDTVVFRYIGTLWELPLSTVPNIAIVIF